MSTLVTVSIANGDTQKVIITNKGAYLRMYLEDGSTAAMPAVNDTVNKKWEAGTETVAVVLSGSSERPHGRVVDFSRVVEFNGNYFVMFADTSDVGTNYVVGGTPCG